MIKLGIDIDGVLGNQFGKFKDIAERYGITDHSYIQDYNGIYKTYTEDNQQLAKLVFEDHLEEFILDQKPIEGSKDGFEKILASPHIKPYIVTSRRKENSDLTLRWLKEYGFTGVEDVLFLEDKLDAPCNVLVDDLYKHVKNYSDNGRMGILMDAPYNTKYDVLRRVSSLDEVFQQLRKYF